MPPTTIPELRRANASEQLPLGVLGDRMAGRLEGGGESASGWRWSSVIGNSGVGAEKRATRSAVCFQAPVSLKTRTASGGEAFAQAQGHGHRRDEG